MEFTPQPVLTNAPLKLVICQLRFPELLGLADSDVRPLQIALREDYPLTEVESAAEITLTPEGLRPTGKTSRVYRFRDDSRAWTVTLTTTTLALETSAYHDFADFALQWRGVAAAALDAFEIGTQERLGLRYVNELATGEATVDELAALVRPELLGVVGAHDQAHDVVSSMHELRFSRADGAATFRHGLIRRPDGSAFYALDFDFYDDEPHELALEEQIETLASWNHRIYELFQWAVQPEAFAAFGPEERSEG